MESKLMHKLIYLAELWTRKLTPETGVTFNACHPGWVRTPGTVSSLPSWFDKLDLREPIQGADTILWLSIADAPKKESGLFWFDRKPVRTHMPLADTHSTPAEISYLYEYSKEFKKPLQLD